jgi:hypothetical protein
MIDTDKYEGHQLSEFKISVAGVNHSWVKRQQTHGAIDTMFVKHATAALIADAPLLLERVIHLEHIVKCARDVLTNIYTYDKDLEDAEWIAWFCDMESEEE